MSGKGGSNNGKGIPGGSRKVVESLKEIVNFPDSEIYAMLKDCNMDPNEAVHRLLSLDPFREVKSKREKKKENKDVDPRSSRGAGIVGHRGGRGGMDRYGRGGSTQFSYNESSVTHGKPAYKRENGSLAYAGSSSNAAGINANQHQTLHSDSEVAENKMSSGGLGDDFFLPSSQSASAFKSPWSGTAGQVTMADIVKMGRPQNKAFAAPPLCGNNHHHAAGPPPSSSYPELPSSQNHASTGSEMNVGMEVAANQHDEWPSIEQPPVASASSVLEVPPDSELFVDTSNLPLDRASQHVNQLDDAQSSEEDDVGAYDDNHAGPSHVSSRNIHEDDSGDSSLFDNNLYGNVGSYVPHMHAFEDNDAEEGASIVAANLQHLSLQNNDQGATPEDDGPSVIIPNHLQVHAQECSHLSFGSFGAGINSGLSGPFSSMPLNNNLEEASEVADSMAAAHSDARNLEYYGEEHLRSNTDENLVPRAGASMGNYDSSSIPQSEVLKEEPSDTAQGNQYTFTSSAPGYNYDNTQPLNDAFNNSQSSSQMQNIAPAPFTNMMQAYSNSLQSSLLASTVQPGREPELPYSPFPVSQSMPIKYSNTASSISGQSISMSEALRAGSISSPQPTQQTLPGGNVATGPALPQHLAVHPYSQPTLPLGHFANMIGYPFLPQSYTYMPSAFQQSFAGNNTYHQSLAAVLPQYKNSVSVSSLPQSAAVASGYGFGNSTSIPTGNFPLNQPTAPTGTTLGYEDLLGSQYKDASHLMSLQQNENSAMWVHGPGSGTMSAVPGNTYYNFQGQNQQPVGYRQGQQPSQQHFGALGYPNYYQSAMPLEHQQQNSRDGSMGGSQGQPSKQTQQLWQNIY